MKPKHLVTCIPSVVGPAAFARAASTPTAGTQVIALPATGLSRRERVGNEEVVNPGEGVV